MVNVCRTSKVYYLAARWLDGSPVMVNVYRTSKVYYFVARRLDGSPEVTDCRAAEPLKFEVFHLTDEPPSHSSDTSLNVALYSVV